MGEPVRLSPTQLQMWMLERMVGQGVYHSPLLFEVRGDLDVDRLRRALEVLVDRHGVLRTRIVWEGREPHQVVEASAPVELIRDDASHLGGEALEQEAERWERELVQRPFDLSAAPPMRAGVLRAGPTSWRLALVFHHIALDGTSLRIFLEELGAAYRDPERRPGGEAPPCFADFARWSRGRSEAGAMDPHLEYWRRQLRGLPELRLPEARPRPATPSFAGGEVRRDLGSGRLEALASLAGEAGATRAMGLIALYAAQLAVRCRDEEVVLGVPVEVRPRADLGGVLGYFVNPVVLRLPVTDGTSFRQLIERVRDQLCEALMHCEAPFPEVVDAVLSRRAGDRNPLFQVLVAVFEPGRETPDLPGLDIRRRMVPSSTARLDQLLYVHQRGDGATLTLEYSRDLFDATQISAQLQELEDLLGAVLARPEQALFDLEVGARRSGVGARPRRAGWRLWRLRRSIRARRKSLTKRFRSLRSHLVLDRGGGPEIATVLVLGSGRSGTTWLLEALAQGLGARAVREPIFPGRDVPAAFAGGGEVPLLPRLRPEERPPAEVEEYLERMLLGRVRTHLVDHTSPVGVYRRRVVKTILGNLLGGWLARRYPEMPIVAVIRNPEDVVASTLRALDRSYRMGKLTARLPDEVLTWGRNFGGPLANAEDLVGQLARRWCIDNRLLLDELAEAPASLVVRYEELCVDPCQDRGAWAELKAHLGRLGWDPWLPPEVLARRSATDLSGTAGSSPSAVLTPEDRDRIRAGAEAFGLGAYLGSG